MLERVPSQMLWHLISLPKDKLYNIVSGSSVNDFIRESLIMLESNAENVTKDTNFFSLIKKNKYLSFKSANVRTTIQKNGKQKEVICQRDVLGLLVSTSNTTKKPVDIEKEMSHPLAPAPLSLCTADGAKRRTVKIKLYDDQ